MLSQCQAAAVAATKPRRRKASTKKIQMQANSDILNNVASYIEELLTNQLPEGHFFHDLEHTRSVVKAAGEICDFMSIPEAEREVALIAAWFHDCGHVVICEGHEEESKRIAQAFLEKAGYPAFKIAKVLRCIEATKVPQRPLDTLGKILCDADLAHLAAKNYFELLLRLRKEWSQIRNEDYTAMEWFELNLRFLRTHQYFTEYGQKVLEDKKQAVVEVLKLVCEFEKQ